MYSTRHKMLLRHWCWLSSSSQAVQTDDTLKTADAVVSVTVEDVNDNPPQFDQSEYSVNLLENSPVGAVLFKAIVSDLDQVD